MRSSILPIAFFLIIISSGCKKEGCISECADNYDAKAKVDDGKCSGCTDSQAINYCAGAAIDNGSCQYDEVSLTVQFVHNVGSAVVEQSAGFSLLIYFI